MNTQLLSIKAKKFGVRLSGFRQKKGVSAEVLSSWIGIPKAELEMLESGETSISLPQIELIALKLGLMTETLLNGKLEGEIDRSKEEAFNKQFASLRDRMIAITLRKTRAEKELTVQEVADRCGITEERLNQYESGSVSIPWPVLERMCECYDIPFTSFISNITAKETPVIIKEESPVNSSQFSNEMDSFIRNPANLPYLELAKKISEIDAAILRSIAEGLLEITY